MIASSWFFLGLLAPMLIGALGVGLLVRGRENPSSPWPAVGWSLGIGLGATAGMLALLGLPPWKPIEAHHWVLIAVLPASVAVALFNAVPRVPQIVLWLLRLCVAGGLAFVLMQSQLPYWSTAKSLAWLGGIGWAMLILWAILHRYAQRPNTGGSLVFVLGATAGAIGVCTIASGSILGGQLAASLAAAIAGGWLASLGRHAQPLLSRGAMDVMFPPIFGLLVFGWYYAWQMQHPASSHMVAGILALAPLGLWASALPWIIHRSIWQRTVLGVAVSLLLLAAAMGLAGYEAALRAQDAGASYY